jgi:beta-fructofuranosidase
LLYRSKDLRAWEYVHMLAQCERAGPSGFDPFDPWAVWECPELFPLGDRHVLIFSTAGRTFWQSGKLDEAAMTFHPERAGIVDYGAFYAAKTQLDEAGNRILWGWITETRPLAEYKAAGWGGMMSLPRVRSLAADGRLRFSVAPAVGQLRGRGQSLNTAASKNKIRPQLDTFRIPACCGEILCAVKRGSQPFELTISGSAESAVPWLTIAYDPDHRDQVLIDARPIPLFLDDAAGLEFHLYADGSVIEVLVNGQVALTRRFYYSGNGPQDLHLHWTGSITGITSLSIWELTPISKDRLTT